MNQPIDKQSNNYQSRGNDPSRTWHAPKLRTIGAIRSQTRGGIIGGIKESIITGTYNHFGTLPS